MSAGRKIASATVKNRTQTPFWNYIRNKLIAVDRLPITPPPGLPTEDGKAVYHNHVRFPNTQSARTPPEPASIPGGVHHKLASNYYLERDARRQVMPPVECGHADDKGKGEENAVRAGEETKTGSSSHLAINKGPCTNFGLNSPTPGFGYAWQRRQEGELDTQRRDAELNRLKKFDGYRGGLS